MLCLRREIRTPQKHRGRSRHAVRGLELVWYQLSDSTREQIIRETEEATVNLSDWRRLHEFANNEKVWKSGIVKDVMSSFSANAQSEGLPLSENE